MILRFTKENDFRMNELADFIFRLFLGFLAHSKRVLKKFIQIG